MGTLETVPSRSSILALLAKINDFLTSLPQRLMLVLTFLMVVASGYLDYLGGLALSLPLIHLIPLTLSSWFGGRRTGYMFAFLSAAVLAWSTLTSLPAGSSRFIAILNVFLELFVFVIIAYLVSAFREVRDRLQNQARTDPLTGVTNSRAFLELAELELQRCRRYSHVCTLIYMDLDNFKLVNDTLGHQEGDRLLRSVADGLRTHCRQVDVVARMGGDEFALLLPETDWEGAEVFAHNMQSSIRDILQKHHPALTLSAGIVTCLEMPLDADDLVRMADHLMYEAKANQKDRMLHNLYEGD
jgi:diguanylate cyclase (GGDEF)-like protein